jgi:hypothetical protein
LYSIDPALKFAIGSKLIRDLVMTSRDLSPGDIEPPAQGYSGFLRQIPAKINRHIPG